MLLKRLLDLLPVITEEFEDGASDEGLRTLPEGWAYLHVTYEHPHVRRLWKQYGDERVFLHAFEPIPEGESGLMHHHPWPAASLVVRGGYEMLLELDEVLVASTFQCPGSAYIMADPRVRHVVLPNPGVETWSIMITGAPFENPVCVLKPANPGERLEPNDPRVLEYAAEWAKLLAHGHSEWDRSHDSPQMMLAATLGLPVAPELG